ncbi:protocadherin-16-like [Sycon ciliatum]|uniref:protocadherin-16-like n=1 Tax=Sycon ciliatum TaxID=27933 RepID=UPI0031F6478B
MNKVLCFALLALVLVCLFSETEGWGRRRRRRFPCNWNRWNSWSFNCNTRCTRGTTYRYRYGYSGYPSCYYRGWQRSGRYCSGKSCQQYCSSGRCYCRSGYRASGSLCYDIDECSSNGGRGPCQTRCHNRVGSYYCSCNYGYYVCSTTRCCPVNCGRPKVPTSCPSYSFKDSQSLTPCKPLPYQSHCSTVYPNSCNLRCPTYYSIATYSASGTFMKNWNSISVIGKSYNIRCQGNSRWTVASTISRFYCRRDNDPPEWLRISSTTINEHSPVVNEHSPVGTVVGYLTTYDPNKYDTHVFTVRPSSAAIFFSVVGNRLVVTFVPKFNQHQGITGDGNSFTITVRVTDRGSPAMYRDQSFTIRILDANEPPERLHLSNMAVKENVKVDSTVGVFSAYDPDLPSSTNPCTWAVTGFNSGFFKVSGNKLLVAKSLNFEAQNNHPLQISCTDFGRPAATTTATFVIDVQDAQEPPITLTINNAQVDEDAKAGQVVGMLTGLDQDQEKLIIAIVGGQVPITAGGSSLTRFGVSSTTCANVPAHDQVKARTKCSANLIVQPKILGAAAGSAGALDFETGGWFQVVFFARDASHPSLHKSLYVNITINDVNEAPTDISILNLTIPETAPGGALVSSLVVTDPDNSQRVVQRPTCTLVPGGDDAYFGITGESPNMELELAQTTMLDYEVKPVYRISVTCNDHGLPPKTITRSFVVNVQDENEAPLNITLSNNRVKEDAPVGTVVGMFSTIDPDVGDSFTYKFAPGFSTAAPFTVNKGRLMTTGKLDYEKNDSYVIDVSSTDQGGLEAIETFVVWVQDVPEPPTDLILDGNHTLPENSSDIAFIGNLIVTDQDVNQDPSCKVTGGIDMQYFSTAGDNGLELVSTAAGSMLDYETMGSDKNLQVEVTCTDLDGLGIKRPFTVRVTDVNEPPTDITLTPSSVKEAQPAGTLVGSLSVTDPDVGQAHNCSVIDTQPQAGQPLLTSLFYVKNQMLYTKKPLDFEATLAYSVEVECSDIPTDGQPSITFDKPIIVTLLDVNEVPGTPCAAFSIGEKKPDGTMVAMLNASDPDNEFSDKQVLTYTVVNSVPFKVDPSTNTLVKNGMLNFEVKKSYNVDIKVTDDGTIQTGNTTFKKVTPLSKTYTCVVNVLDNNDPHVSASIRLVPSNASVTEHAAAGTVIAKAFTDDVDASAKHTYKILETDVPFTMVGSDVTVTASGLLVDFEANSDDIKITIASTDEHNHTAT